MTLEEHIRDVVMEADGGLTEQEVWHLVKDRIFDEIKPTLKALTKDGTLRSIPGAGGHKTRYFKPERPPLQRR